MDGWARSYVQSTGRTGIWFQRGTETRSTVNGQRSTGQTAQNGPRRHTNGWGEAIPPAQLGGMQPHHRSLLAWVEAKEVSRAAYRACRDHWKPPAAPIFDQFQRAALSIRLNIAEGFALADFGRFGNHLAIAYGSAVETEDCLDLMLEEEILPKVLAAQTIERCQRCERLLLGLLKKYRPLGGSR